MMASEDYFERANAEDVEQLEYEVRMSRERLLLRCGATFRDMLLKQVFSTEMSETGDTVNYWVRQETGEVPSPPLGRGPRSLSFLLEGVNPYQERLERLRIHVPIDRDFDQINPEDIDRLATVDEVYVERMVQEEPSKFRLLSRYAINKVRSFQYEERENDFYEIVQDGLVSEAAARPVPESLTRLARIRLDVVRFVAKQQREKIVGEGDNVDL